MSVTLLPSTLPVLVTPRLLLRRMTLDDQASLYRIYGDAEVMRYASDPVFESPTTVVQLLDSVDRLLASGQSLEWGIEERSCAALIGSCGLHSADSDSNSAEVGALLMRDRWGQGLMQEALTAVIDYAWHTLQLQALRAVIDADNQRSIRLFQALGFSAAGAGRYGRRRPAQ